MANKLQRFLFLGSVPSTYIATNSVTPDLPKPLETDNLLFESTDQQILDTLNKAAADLSSGLTDPVRLAYATSLCMKSPRLKLRQLTSQALPSLCPTSDGLFRLLQALSALSRQGVNKTGMWGAGLRKGVKRWYNKWITEGEERLALILISEKACHGWSHNDVLKLIHFRAPTPEVDAIIQYFAFGKSESLSKLSPSLQSLANKVNELKTCEDGVRAAALLNELKILPYAMPAKFHKDPQVWAAYIRNLPLAHVLNRLEFLASKKKAGVTELILRLDNGDIDDLDAGQVMIYLAKYSACHHNEAKTRAIKRKNDETTVKEASGFSDDKKQEKKKPPPKFTVAADLTVVATVSKILNTCLEKIANENRTWSFLFDLSKDYYTAPKCSQPHYLLVSDALMYTMRYLNQTGQVFHYQNNTATISPDLLSQTTDFVNLVRKKINFSASSPATLVHSNTDVVVYVCDSKPRMKCLETLMKALREARNKPDMRLVILLPMGYRGCNVEGENTLVVCGFDERTLRLINYFAKGVF